MNFEFSEEQNLLREQARGFLQDNCSTKVVRESLENGGEFNKELWRKVAEMGWTSPGQKNTVSLRGASRREICP